MMGSELEGCICSRRTRSLMLSSCSGLVWFLSHHVSPEVGELDVQRRQQFYAASAGEGGHGDLPSVE